MTRYPTMVRPVLQKFQEGQLAIERRFSSMNQGASIGVTDFEAFEVELYGYFDQQDRAFYKAVTEAGGMAAKPRIIDFLYEDARQVKIDVVKFFETYAGCWGRRRHQDAARREFNCLKEGILQRFEIERHYLFPLLQK